MKKISENDVIKTIEFALEISPGSIGLDTQSEDVVSWDSLGHLNILTQLDVLFEGGVADINEIASATSVPKILDTLRQHLLI